MQPSRRLSNTKDESTSPLSFLSTIRENNGISSSSLLRARPAFITLLKRAALFFSPKPKTEELVLQVAKEYHQLSAMTKKEEAKASSPQEKARSAEMLTASTERTCQDFERGHCVVCLAIYLSFPHLFAHLSLLSPFSAKRVRSNSPLSLGCAGGVAIPYHSCGNFQDAFLMCVCSAKASAAIPTKTKFDWECLASSIEALGRTYADTSRQNQALTCFATVIDISNQIGKPIPISAVHYMSTCCTELGKDIDFLPLYYSEIRDSYKASGSDNSEAYLQFLLNTIIYLDRKEHAEEISTLWKEAQVSIRKLGSSIHPDIWLLFARASSTMGNLQATLHALEAVEIILDMKCEDYTIPWAGRTVLLICFPFNVCFACLRLLLTSWPCSRWAW